MKTSIQQQIVGAEHLLAGHSQVDEVPVSIFGDTRKASLYDAMRVVGTPSVYWHYIVEAYQTAGGLSAPPTRRVLPVGDEKYADDNSACNVQGQTRLQLLLEVLSQTRLDEREKASLVDEFRARSGLVACYVRGG